MQQIQDIIKNSNYFYCYGHLGSDSHSWSDFRTEPLLRRVFSKKRKNVMALIDLKDIVT